MLIAPRRISVTRGVTILLGLTGTAAGLTMLFIGMRSVMDIGGACASGNQPFVIDNPCPAGAVLLTIGGAWLGIISAFVYVGSSLGTGIPGFAGFLWPALFLSLGWNFFEYAFDPPFGGGLAWGWLICGIVFAVMGGVPLWVVLTAGRRDRPSHPGVDALLGPPGIKTAARIIRPNQDLLSRLSALDAAYQAGSLTADEYERAKDRIEREER